MFRPRFLYVLLFALSLIVCVPGCGEITDGYIYIDNTGNSAVTVLVDDVEMCQVEPGTFEKIMVKLGPHQITVKSSGRTIYSDTHVLDSGDRPFRRPTYLLNPDGTQRYCDISILYGDDYDMERRRDSLLQVADRVENQGDESARAELDRRIAKEFEEMSRDIVVFGDRPWIRFETSSNVLTPVANTVYGSKRREGAERSALIRISKQWNAKIAKVLRVKKPTLRDLHRLAEVQSQVLELVPFRG